jgi:hypothetical protein
MGNKEYGADFANRYISFGNAKVGTSNYKELSEGYKTSSGGKDLTKLITDKTSGSYWNPVTGETSTMVDIDKANEFTAGMGFSLDA